MKKHSKSTSLEEAVEKELSLSKYTPSKCVSKQRTVSATGDFSIVNTEKNGKRIVISQRVLESLDSPETIQFSYSKRILIFGESLYQDGNDISIKYSGKKGIIYSADLITEITERFALDFSNRTMMTFPAKIKVADDKNIVSVTIIPKEI